MAHFPSLCYLTGVQENLSSTTLVLAGGMGALGLVLPPLFHVLGSGAVFLPMHLPLVTLGFLVPPRVSLQVVLLVPLLSSLATGMPPLFPTVPAMILELGAACLTGWILYRSWRKPLVLALPAALLAGILAGSAATWAFLTAGPLLGLHLPRTATLLSRVAAALPGYAIQLAGVPLLLGAASRFLSREEARA